MTDCCHQCNEALLDTDQRLNCPGCLEPFHACCWTAHGADCLSRNPPRPLLLPPYVQTAGPRPEAGLEPYERDTPRCRVCLGSMPSGRPFCFQCGARPAAPPVPTRYALVIESASGRPPGATTAALLARLLPSSARGDIARLLANLPGTLLLETVPDRIDLLVRRLEREGLRVQVVATPSPLRLTRAFAAEMQRRPSLLAELGALGGLTGLGLTMEPLLGVGVMTFTAVRAISHFAGFLKRSTLPVQRLEALQHPLAHDRGERLRQALQALRDPDLRELVKRALVGHEQAVAAAEGDNPLIEHLWQPVAPLLYRYLEQIVALAGRADRLDQYLRDQPDQAEEREKMVAALELEEALEEHVRALRSLTGQEQRREDLAAAIRLMRARIERSVQSLQTLRGSLLQLSLLGDGQGSSLSTLASTLEEEIEAMAMTLREVEELRSGALMSRRLGDRIERGRGQAARGGRGSATDGREERSADVESGSAGREEAEGRSPKRTEAAAALNAAGSPGRRRL